ncbi:hypothetical protein EDB89DRAFT_2064625 [Lactarius sanguifluus]|nr:hypothetical protein EDB89DRAFT_2064625 [Lactarius sanguifluus]
MTTHFRVYVPFRDMLCPFRSRNISCIGDLLEAVWRDVILPLGDQQLNIFRCSLRSLLVPVPVEPRDTLQDRVVHSPHDNGSAGARDTDAVPPGWSDPNDLHVYLYIDLGPKVRVAEKLYETLWGEDLNVILEEISDGGNTWKYVPKTRIDHLKMRELGYKETRGLLVRPEYNVTFDVLQQDHSIAEDCGGVIVTGQPGIGKTCFLYYLLFRRLSERRPVALEQPEFFILFHEGGVYRYPLKADPRYLPDGTWVLSDSNDEAPKPCSTFRSAAKLRIAWLIQTSSPQMKRWEDWVKYCDADTFVMNHVSIEEITALSKIFGLDVSNIQRLYRKWGPSARTCLKLLSEGKEGPHELKVKSAAIEFVKTADANFNVSKVSHLIFSVRPEAQNRTGRRSQVAEMATDHIKDIISYAAADASAQVQIDFFQMISTQPSFRAPAGTMFEGFVLSWLYARPNAEPLRCFATNQADLEIPACGKEQTTFFDRKSSLNPKDVNGWNKPPFCLLPKPKNFPTADAIVITREFVITIQVTLSNEHDANQAGFDEIKKIIPASLRTTPSKQDKPWRHVFITHSDDWAESLRAQNLPGLPDGALAYSGVFDILRSGVTRKHVEALNEKKQSGNSMEVD